jgi:hypothetical protein
MIGLRGTVVLLLVFAALTAAPTAVRADDGEDDERADRGPADLSFEYFGLELTPGSIMLTDPPVFDGETPPPRAQIGGGITIRAIRRRWEYGYLTAFQAGFYVSRASGNGQDTIVARLEMEGGAIVPGTDRRLEVGLGAGIGVLGIGYASHCDGTCRKGGSGALISPVVRYLFVDRPHVTIGASLRAIIPLSTNGGEACFGDCTGFGSVMLGSVEFGIGRGAS